MSGELPQIPEHVHVFFFYAIKELVLNAIKHSGKNQVSIRMQYDDDYIVAQVEDVGTSFDVAKVECGLEQPETFGLFQIRERLEALGGSMYLGNTDAGGARIWMLVPLSN